jgi:hypothetical protein
MCTPYNAHHLQIEHQVQLTDIAEISIERLHQAVNELQYSQLVLHREAIVQKRQEAANTRTPVIGKKIVKTTLQEPIGLFDELTSSLSTPTKKNSDAYLL